MDIRVLGSLEASDGDRKVDLGLRQARTIFAVLALQPGVPVRSARLAEALWPDTPPPKWEATVQSNVSRLRRALEPNRPPRSPSERLPTQGDAYLLQVSDDEIDSRRFERLASEGRSTLARGEHSKAHEIFGRALAEWRGPVLADFRDPELLSVEVSRLEELRVLTAEERAEAALSAGNHRHAITDLEALVAENPLRERCWELLILALYRSGRQSEALRRFREVRGLLVSELGIEPGPSLCELENSILHQEIGLAPRIDVPVETGNDVLPVPAWLSCPDDEFVGRAAELDDVLSAFAQAVDGERRLVLVVGEPGIGKTRLVREASRELEKAGALVLGGRCVEAPLHMLQPLAEAVERLAICHADRFGQDFPQDVAVLATLIPELSRYAPPQPSVEGEAYRYLLFRAVSHLLDSRVTVRPVAMVLDDLHWATQASLQLLSLLLTDEDRGPLLVIGTARDTEPNPALAALVADLRRDRRLDRVSLDGLGPDEVASLAASRGAYMAWPDLHALARGNPFYVEELVRHIAETGGALEGNALPDSVRETIAQRLLRLPAEVRRILGIAAVAGPEFRLDVVARAAGFGIDAADEALSIAATAGIVAEQSSPAGTYCFSHTLIQAVLLEGLGAARRARVHRQFGEALADLGGEDIEIARQLLAASSDLSDVIPGAEAALSAAASAIGRYAYDDAVAILRTAMEALEANPAGNLGLKCRVLTALAMSLRQAGLYDERPRVLEAAWSHGTRAADLELLAGVVVEGFGGTIAPPEPWPARAEQIRAQLSESSSRRVLLTAVSAYVYSGESGDRARRLAEWALARIDVLQPEERRIALECCILALTAWSPIERITDLARAALAAAQESGSVFGMIESQSICRFVFLARGDLAASDAAAREYETLVRAVKIPRFTAGVEQRRAMRALLVGRFTEAEAHAGTAVSLQPLPEFVEGFAVQLFALRFEQGRLDEIRPTVEAWATQQMRPAWTIGYGALLADLGELEEAAATIAPLSRTGFETVPRDDVYLLSLGAAAAAVVLIGDRNTASTLRELLSPHASRVIVAGQGALCWGSVQRFLAPLNSLLGDVERASMHFEAAMSVHERLGALPFLARDRLAYADLLDSVGGDAVRIEDLSRTGLALARELGMRTLLARHEDLRSDPRQTT
ncbi:MAG: hypothetical protein DYH08_07885 [Actinobacteria bacterium ATB1]|nr:hypothetical protein [Actinobacteria bacterium ATB1]